MKDKPAGQLPSPDQPPSAEDATEAQLSRQQLLEVSRKLLNTTDEKEARRIIAAGWPEGTPEFEAFLRHWRQNRETEGWKVS